MDYREITLMGIEGLRSHLLRSFLSMLGIIFGVGAVISMLSIGEGAKQQALEQIQLLGMNNIIVQDTPVEAGLETEKNPESSPGLQIADARAVRELIPHVDKTVPLRDMPLVVYHGRDRMKAMVIGTTPEYIEVMNYAPREGSFFSYIEVEEARRVCVLGSGIKRDLFLFRNPLGEKVKIGDQWFTVIGIMEERFIAAGQSSLIPMHDMNQDIYIPITAALKRFSRRTDDSEIHRFIAHVRDVSRIQEAANILNATMKRRHNSVEDFSISVPEALLRQSRQTQRIFNIVMGAIAGISLVVGGIGIMNIMLATVLERTREIGIRRSLGARHFDILTQFLIEAVMLSFAGGIIGIALGVILTKVIALYAHWRTIVSPEAIMLAFGVSVGVGILFGVYPARRAASMDPIEALRYE